MKYFKDIKDRKVCLLCSYYCKLKNQQIGICGINKNNGNKIECLTYGYVAALNIDPIEKKPLYHFLPNSKSLSLGTVGCNFKCNFCQNHSISQKKIVTKSKAISPKEIVDLAKDNKCMSISYTYNEPTIFYPFAKDIAIRAKEFNIKSVFVSNGFESKEVIFDMKGIIDAINVDLKSFNNKYYKKSLGGNLKTVCDNLLRLKELGIYTEITTLIVPTRNDSKNELRNIVKFIKNNLGEDMVWHISAFHPDYKELNLSRTSDDSLQLAYDLAKEEGLNYVYRGNSNFENSTYCKFCKKLLIKRKYFQVLEYNMKKDRCPNCHNRVQGVFYEY